STFFENMAGTNFNSRITGQLAPPNVLVLGQYNIPSTAKRPNTQADIGVTLLATNKFRLSNTFRVEDFTIDGVATFNDIFTVTRAKDDIENNHTNAFFGGFKARPKKNWTLYFDGEHGTADNVFTRIGNYNYTNVRAKSRFAPNRKLSFNLGAIIRNNTNPSEI